MTPELWAAILASLGGIITTGKWAVGRWEKGEELNRGSLQRMTDALIANTASNAVLIVKMDTLIASNAALANKVDGISDFVNEHTPVEHMRTRTPARGLRIARPGTHHDEDK